MSQRQGGSASSVSRLDLRSEDTRSQCVCVCGAVCVAVGWFGVYGGGLLRSSVLNLSADSVEGLKLVNSLNLSRACGRSQAGRKPSASVAGHVCSYDFCCFAFLCFPVVGSGCSNESNYCC